MAVAKLVCGDCAGPLSPSDVRCPSCGASIEKEEAPAGKAPCGVCGQPNDPGAEFCRSCGARLAVRSPARSGKGRKPFRQQGKQEGQPARSAGIWQIISAVAVLSLLSYLVYMQIGGEKSSSPPGSPSGSPGGTPSSSGIGLPSVDLKPLEDAVRERPADAGAQLRLANALHDNRMLARAVDAYRKYLSLRPGDPDARTDLGICYFQQAQADSINRDALLHQAATAMEEAFNSSPRPHQPSAFNLGVVFLHLSDLERSNTWFRKAVEINPESDLGKRAQNMIAQHTIPQ
ncbi:MAG TPA: tetratricopeptide repeat protein [Bacteroidota bacterium]|nr:tetratricopeptide repeat protein [Bacteroidota bacterium]